MPSLPWRLYKSRELGINRGKKKTQRGEKKEGEEGEKGGREKKGGGKVGGRLR